ncbi:MAG TPA: divalent-cation tolerance protein CutA [Geminicoccaceae bacterium]
MTLRLCYVTAGDREEALRLGRALVEERLAACANVIDGMTSVYEWAGAVEQAEEAVLILKTRADLIPRVVERVRALHSYDIPCIVSLPIEAGNPDFLTWIATQTAGS